MTTGAIGTRPASRRHVLRLAAALPFAYRASAADSDICGIRLNPLWESGFKAESAGDFHWNKPIRQRPLWSELSWKDRRDHLKLLSQAYGALASSGKKTGLLYHTWVHDYFCNGGQIAMPHAPKTSGNSIHDNYFFLPWHRAFLFFHERILQDCLPKDAAANFSLPVYDWDNADGQNLPRHYQTLRSVPAKFCTPFHGVQNAPAFETLYIQNWLLSNSVEEFVGSSTQGAVGSVGGPHNDVHHQLGNLMSAMSSAAGDPVFYAHHANVDRYWDYWARQYKDRDWYKRDYKATYWPDGHFYFYDRGEKLVKISVQQMMKPELLGYKYTQPSIPILKFQPVSLTLTAPTQMEMTPLLNDILAAANQPGSQDYTILLQTFPRALADLSSTPNIPVRVFGTTTAPLSGGTTQRVGIRIKASDTPIVIGQFRVLKEHSHSGSIVSTGNLGTAALNLLATAAGSREAIEVVCGEANAGGQGFAGSVASLVNVKSSIKVPDEPAERLKKP